MSWITCAHHCVDIATCGLKGFNGLVKFTPSDKDSTKNAKFTIFTHHDGSLFVRNDDNIHSAVAYDKDGKVIGSTDINVRLNSPYKYMNFDNLLSGVHDIKLFDNHGKEVTSNKKMFFFGRY